MRALLALRNGFCELFSIARIRPSRVSSELATVVEEEERRERGLGGVVDGLLTTVVVCHRLTPRALVVVRREADVCGRNRNLADRSPQRPHPITRGTRRIPRRSFPVATFDTHRTSSGSGGIIIIYPALLTIQEHKQRSLPPKPKPKPKPKAKANAKTKARARSERCSACHSSPPPKYDSGAVCACPLAHGSRVVSTGAQIGPQLACCPPAHPFPLLH
jgi:hypothetical protein